MKHLRDVNESYWQHCRTALGFAVRLILVGIACFIHAICPCLFVETSSRTITDIKQKLDQRNAR